MVVELILSGVFFIICFNEQLGGWFSAATQDGGSQRSLPTGKAEWMSALVAASAMRLGGWRLPRMRGQAPDVALPSTSNDPGVQLAYSGRTRRQQSTPSASQGPQDPLEVINQLYGISIVRTPGLYLFLFLLTFVVAAGTEETLKYMTPLRFRACRHSACPYVYLVCATACALGFSTVENMGYTLQASSGGPGPPPPRQPEPVGPLAPSTASSAVHLGTSSEGGASGGEDLDLAARAYTAYSRAVVAVAAHALFGALVGLGLTKKHVLGQPLQAWQILLPSVLAHGTFDLQQMLLVLLVWDEEMQTVLTVLLDGLVLLAAALYLWRQLARLPLPSRQAVVALVQDGDAASLATEETEGLGSEAEGDHQRLLPLASTAPTSLGCLGS